MLLILMILSTTVAIVSLVLTAHASRSSTWRSSMVSGLSVFVAATLGLAGNVVAWWATQHDNWRQAPSPGVGPTLLVAVLPALLAVMTARIAAGLIDVAPSVVHDASPIVLTPGEHVVWWQRLASHWFAITGAALIMAGLAEAALGLKAGPFAAATLLVAGVALLMVGRAGVRVDDVGLHISYGPFGWPRQTFRVADIDNASAILVRPTEWGGWGYRGSVRILKRAAFVLRKGEGIRLDLRGNRVFVVTVPDAERGAALLNALAIRQKSLA